MRLSRMMAAGRVFAWAFVLALPACQPSAEQGTARSGGDPSALIQAGRFDEALALLEDSRGPQSQLLIGVALAGKARTAGPSGTEILTGDAEVARTALDAVIAAQPASGAARLAWADLLAPYVLAARAAEGGASAVVAQGAEGGEGEPEPAAPVPLPAAADVVAAYRIAVGQDATRAPALDGLVDFCRVAECLAEADAAYRELLEAMPQDRELPAEYGDFLANDYGDRARALEQYGVALIWRPDDKDLRSRVARVHIAQGLDYVEWGEYPQAQKAFAEARPYIASTDSPEWAQLQEGVARLDRIRPQR